MNDAKPTCGWNEAKPYHPPESEPPVRSGELVGRRLETFVKMFVGCKWNDAGPLGWHKPDDEKYITKESLLAAQQRGPTTATPERKGNLQ